MSRTPEQRFADNFDCDLYRLITRAEGREGKWFGIALELRQARNMVRDRMHPDDRKRS